MAPGECWRVETLLFAVVITKWSATTRRLTGNARNGQGQWKEKGFSLSGYKKRVRVSRTRDETEHCVRRPCY
ncbi:hypothetical protein B0J12DRAFT_659782 [Macrophomina phaseolina]|uniref:Secreted protein n=1 Tax=Macrophomina phaseolina TaxID=35725 RepID=A0ABQ8GEM3_9PEZI|nr:hypothetical protein B0J12DRAFT_659782 [Macrophomina phaseolina]